MMTFQIELIHYFKFENKNFRKRLILKNDLIIKLIHIEYWYYIEFPNSELIHILNLKIKILEKDFYQK